MNILIIEDKPEKIKLYEEHIHEWHVKNELGNSVKIDKARYMAEANQYIYKNKYDLIIFDIYIPFYEQDTEEVNVTKDIIFAVNGSQNKSTEAIVITALPSPDDNSIFNDNNIVYVCFDEGNVWQDTLTRKLIRVAEKTRFDFIILCALSKERKAYESTDAITGQLKSIAGLNCQEMTIGNRKGLCIKPTRMGLVNMAITATRAISMFEPEFVGMTGICAGKSNNANMLDVLICSHAWDYQTGKYVNGKFLQEPYQIPLPNEQQTLVSQFIERANLKSNIIQSFEHIDDAVKMTVRSGPIASGSSVVADADKMEEIKEQHRKMLGLEMEIMAMYEAAAQAECQPKCLAIKTATDFGDINKSNTEDYQEVGSVMSARCMVEFIKEVL